MPNQKTPESYRVVSLTPETLDALLKLRKRAEMFGPVEPSHFVFAAFRTSSASETVRGCVLERWKVYRLALW